MCCTNLGEEPGDDGDEGQGEHVDGARVNSIHSHGRAVGTVVLGGDHGDEGQNEEKGGSKLVHVERVGGRASSN